MEKMQKVGIAADHGGFELKEFLKKEFVDTIEFIDFGTFNEESVDYPDIAKNAIQELKAGKVYKLVLICGTGIGISIAANRFKGIRAALCHDQLTAEYSRKHNDSNVLALGGRILGKELAKNILKTWMNTEFEAGRHLKRIEQLDQF